MNLGSKVNPGGPGPAGQLSNDDVIKKLTPMIESLVDRHTPEHYNSGGKNPEIRNTHWKSVSRAHVGNTC